MTAYNKNHREECGSSGWEEKNTHIQETHPVFLLFLSVFRNKTKQINYGVSYCLGHMLPCTEPLDYGDLCFSCALTPTHTTIDATHFSAPSCWRGNVAVKTMQADCGEVGN